MQYNETANTSNMENVMLIHDTLSSPFYSYSNEKSFPIVFSNTTTQEELLNLLNSKFSTIKRVCLISHYTEDPSFLNETGLFITTNVQFMINLVKTFKVENLDFLACNTLQSNEWKNYYQYNFESTAEKVSLLEKIILY